MKRLDRYLLSQFMVLFGFFALVLVSVYWMNRAVLLFDRLIGDGQTASVVLEFTALTLPNVIKAVLPVAAFAAVLTTINRLNQDSEFVVMKALGVSPWRLAVPAVAMGLIVMVMLSALTHVLVPAAKARLADREAEVARDLSAQLLVEGTFQHPAEGLTVYVRSISDLGVLKDIYISDRRSDRTRTTYTAEKALIVRTETGPKLVMFNGMAQVLRQSDSALSVTRFANFTYDLGTILAGRERSARDVEELSTARLIAPDDAVFAATGATPEALRTLVHERFAEPLLAPAAVLLGFSILMLGSFSRFGLWREIGIAVVALIVLNLIQNAVTGQVNKDAQLWPLYYGVPLLGIAAGVVMLGLAALPRRRRRSAQEVPA
ncbi:LPS export ABC transporter permease LptF [Pseudothioclava arenosa]|uniref:LPS export ABC transporter permease LptF n=1 Tax=Pseudothioclava arenosa TaxID=1795308 RepID=A0A2A4CKN1_9RHOB|nr:LPS export ABC transporter permease LptF [Pseudothioclava arenosa]PCD75831.1 LPS export ABC transporter permease LptF [Pseudothioclava arenosa]